MKKKTIKKIVPAYEMTHTTYQCEGCNAELEFEGSIRECEICGKEICPNCSTYLDMVKDELIYEGEDLYLRSSDNNENFIPYIKVCQDCYNKIKVNEKDYAAKIQELVNDFNKNLEQLSNMYLKGECK